MAFCSNCGAKLADGAKFCTECGQKFGDSMPAEPQANETAAPQQQVYTVPQPTYTAPAQPQRTAKPAPKRISPLPFIIGGAGLLVVIVVVLIIVLGGKSNKPASGDTIVGSGISESAEATAIQKQWNGTWYGCMHAIDNLDCYMIVDVDAEGEGRFAVYLDGADKAFAIGTCEASENSLRATGGTISGGIDMNTYNWMFLPMPDYPDQYSMGDTIEHDGLEFEFTMFMKQWGGSWQDEIESDFAIVPPSVESYNRAVENGELPPIGFAPIGYNGASAPGSGEVTEPADTSGVEAEPQPEEDYGKSVKDADGIVPLVALADMGAYCEEFREEVSYDDVYAMAGDIHGFPMTDSAVWKETDLHQYMWSASTGEYICINFTVDNDGNEYWRSMSYTPGLFREPS